MLATVDKVSVLRKKEVSVFRKKERKVRNKAEGAQGHGLSSVAGAYKHRQNEVWRNRLCSDISEQIGTEHWARAPGAIRDPSNE